MATFVPGRKIPRSKLVDRWDVKVIIEDPEFLLYRIYDKRPGRTSEPEKGDQYTHREFLDYFRNIGIVTDIKTFESLVWSFGGAVMDTSTGEVVALPRQFKTN